MGYSIRYGTSKYDKKVISKTGKRFLFAATVFTLVVLLSILFPSQIASVRRHLLPFLEPNVQEAFGEMISEIGDGTDFTDAAAAFCREIVGEASN